MTAFRGAFTALVTPFREGAIDEDALRLLVERQIEGGVHGLVPCGTTGESVVLNEQETRQVIRTVVAQARGRVPVVAGAGTNDTRKTIALASLAKDEGVDGLLLVCPYYNKPTQRGLEAHFRAVLREVSLPTMLYNIPGRCSVDLSVETLHRLTDLSDIVAIKEATGTVARAQEILARCGDRIAVLSGDDALTLPMMAVGAVGVVSVTSNLLPAEMARLVTCLLEGRVTEARALNQQLLAVHEALFVEANPGPVKGAMAAAKLLAPEIRLPLVWPEEATVAGVQHALQGVTGKGDR
ncbi:MAG: 4-hydroxy-tetrahydrodipicolinate synthase [Myxococcota bacterium]